MIIDDKFLDPNGILKTLSDLQQKVAALSERVEALESSLNNQSAG